MKLATYNIWNSETGGSLRRQYIANEINKIQADAICLQEVSGRDQAEWLADRCGFPHVDFQAYENGSEGLCIMSRQPFIEKESLYAKANALLITMEINSHKWCIVNLHLPWDSALRREEQIVYIVTETKKQQADYYLLAGDFNASTQSSVQAFLRGDWSLHRTEACPNWFDLAEAFAECTGSDPQPTLHFRRNPRWQGKNTLETNQRFDRILLCNPYPRDYPLLTDFQLFGETVYPDLQLCASDHYGVAANLALAEA